MAKPRMFRIVEVVMGIGKDMQFCQSARGQQFNAFAQNAFVPGSDDLKQRQRRAIEYGHGHGTAAHSAWAVENDRDAYPAAALGFDRVRRAGARLAPAAFPLAAGLRARRLALMPCFSLSLSMSSWMSQVSG